jgi:YVTN family beta-propeller protein
MKKTIIVFPALSILLFLAVIFTSCQSDNPVTVNNNPVVQIATSKGAYVLSEGSFTTGSARLSLYSSVKDTFYSSIFSNGALGLFPDGMLVTTYNVYVTEQGSFNGPGKVHKLDTSGRVVLSSAPFGKNPYSLAIANNKIYVTNGPAGNVSVLDQNSLAEIKTITVGAYPQEIFELGYTIFVGNKSVFGGTQDSTISVIDAAKDSVIKTITVRKDPSSIAYRNGGKIYVGCPDPANIIYTIDASTFNKIDSVVSPLGFVSDISVDINSSNIYFIGGLSGSADKIVKLDMSNKTFTTIITANSGSTFYGYGFDYYNMKHYVLDAKNFQVDGSLYIYDINNSLQRTFATGISPRRVVFKF